MTHANYTSIITSIVLVLLMAIVLVMRDEDKLKKIAKDLETPSFLFFLCIIIGLSVFGLLTSDKRINYATKHAIVALIVAYLSHLDMIFVAFFTVGIFAYFTQEDTD